MATTLLVAVGAGIAVLTGIGAGIGIGKALLPQWTPSQDSGSGRQDQQIPSFRLCAAEATAIYGFVIALLIILFLG